MFSRIWSDLWSGLPWYPFTNWEGCFSANFFDLWFFPLSSYHSIKFQSCFPTCTSQKTSFPHDIKIIQEEIQVFTSKKISLWLKKISHELVSHFERLDFNSSIPKIDVRPMSVSQSNYQVYLLFHFNNLIPSRKGDRFQENFPRDSPSQLIMNLTEYLAWNMFEKMKKLTCLTPNRSLMS